MSDHKEKDSLVYQIIHLTEEVSKRFSDGDDEEKQWMIQATENPILKEMLPTITVMMLHVLAAIGKLEPVNGITVSKNMEIPKGTVSKITRKLIDLDLIRKRQMPNNKKEIIFYMTSLGHELFEVHNELHKQIDKNVIRFLNQYQSNELQFLTKVLKDTLEQSWVQSEEKSP